MKKNFGKVYQIYLKPKTQTFLYILQSESVNKIVLALRFVEKSTWEVIFLSRKKYSKIIFWNPYCSESLLFRFEAWKKRNIKKKIYIL
jgi:hypothetical protein